MRSNACRIRLAPRRRSNASTTHIAFRSASFIMAAEFLNVFGALSTVDLGVVVTMLWCVGRNEEGRRGGWEVRPIGEQTDLRRRSTSCDHLEQEYRETARRRTPRPREQIGVKRKDFVHAPSNRELSTTPAVCGAEWVSCLERASQVPREKKTHEALVRVSRGALPRASRNAPRDSAARPSSPLSILILVQGLVLFWRSRHP